MNTMDGDAEPGVPPTEDGATLVHRIRAGDRHAAAEFIVRYGPRLRRRIRSKLGPSMRRLFDSHDILSTLSRRLDTFVRDRRLNVENEAQLWAFVQKMADNATIDKGRLLKRLRSAEAEDSRFAREFLRRIEDAESTEREGGEVVIERALTLIEDPVDRQILLLWLAGTPHTVTAECVGLTAATVRKRWQTIREWLRGHLDLEVEP
ncbi:MAG: sigma-70 family RNA polymerase sigma factor [Phycisphaeraceae bacterium]|nr:sigma-70 family RNA polymerase sigma factor [Phycisphaeraceae bacterium]